MLARSADFMMARKDKISWPMLFEIKSLNIKIENDNAKFQNHFRLTY